MKNTTFKFIIPACAAAFAAALLSGCAKDLADKESACGRADRLITYNVVFDWTRSAGQSYERTCPATALKAEGEAIIPLTCTESDNIGGIATRGSLANTSGSTASLSGFLSAVDSTFHVYAYSDDGQSYFGQDAEGHDKAEAVKWDEQYGKWASATPYYWKHNDMLRMKAYANMPLDGKSTITLHNDGNDYWFSVDYVVPEDTKDQRDLLLGSLYYGNGGIRGEASFSFYHPLTAVRFKRSKDLPSNITGIESIIVKGVYASGTVTQDRTDPSKLVWGTPNGGSTVSQKAEGMLNVSDDDIDGDPFLLIPQDLSAQSVELTVNLIFDGHAVPFNAILDSGKWEAGKVYTYTVGYSESLQIEVSLSAEESIKDGTAVRKDASVRNIGTEKCYVRAIAKGYIKDEEGAISSTWLYTSGDHLNENRGTFLPSGVGSTSTPWNLNWIQGSDGFWYYKRPLVGTTDLEYGEKGQTTNMFDSYIIDELRTGEIFVMTISVQCVLYDDEKEFVKAAWGEDAAALLQ